MKNPLAHTQECIDASHGLWPARVRGDKRPRPLGIDVFENKSLEIIGKSHWLLPGLWFIPPTAWALYEAWNVHQNPLLIAGLFACGVLVWTLTEYVLHRFLFHMKAGDSDTSKMRAFLLHGYHHEFPNDRYRLVAPPMMSWPVGLILAALHYACFGQYWQGIMAGTMMGYLSYDWIHYYSHHAKPTTAMGKWIRNYHLRHHFEDHDTRYGVSSPLWDVIFGTFRGLSKTSQPSEQDDRTIA